jgi:endonuclease/exonuclease/phosphatase family metal-dependent hydrolase
VTRKKPLRVMAFNIHGGRPRVGPADLEATARVIARERPDVVGLQEVHRYLPPPYVFHDAPRRLRELLRMEVRFVPTFGLGRSGYGNAVLSRVPPSRVRRVRLPAPPWAEPRALVDARLTLAGQPVRFLNAHLSPQARLRRPQVRAIAERVRREDQPTILAGDLNADAHGEELRLLREAGLTDFCARDVMTFPCHAPHCRLDYILVSRHFEVLECRAVETDVSDHFPLVAEVVLR